MKKNFIAALVACSLVASCANGKKEKEYNSKSRFEIYADKEKAPAVESEFDSLSYAVGVNLSQMLSQQLSDIPLDYEVLTDAFKSKINGTSSVSTEDAQATLQDYFMNKRQARLQEITATNAVADSIAIAGGEPEADVLARRATAPADEAMFESAEERTKVSRAMGLDLGNSVKMSKIPVFAGCAVEAFNDVKNGAELKISEADAAGLIQKFFMVDFPKMNAEASQAWLARVKTKDGIKSTESGILYRIEQKGDENLIATDDRDVVKVKYTGKTRDGKVFDSSRFGDMDSRKLEYMKSQSKDGVLSADAEVIDLPLNRVIPGWTEGMKLIGKGGRISLWIPSELAYGERGSQGAIGPNEALYFDVEVVDVTPYQEPEPVAETETETEPETPEISTQAVE